MIEVLIVIGILAILFSLGIPIARNFYLDYQFDGEIQLLSSLLRHARNLSMVNYNQSGHGLYVGPTDFVVFQGTSYASRVVAQDRIFPRNTGVAVIGPVELVFAALSGQSASSTYTLSVIGKSREIFMNPEGLVYE